MRREILFKAKRKNWRELPKEEQWVYGYYVSGINSYEEQVHIIFDPTTIFHSNGETDGWDEIDPETLCQYTGLTDRNGNNIWENDIVERTDRRNGLYLFREQPKMNCKVVYSHRHGFDTEPSCGYFDNKSALECKVIGNVFDNKKLLKGSEQE